MRISSGAGTPWGSLNSCRGNNRQPPARSIFDQTAASSHPQNCSNHGRGWRCARTARFQLWFARARHLPIVTSHARDTGAAGARLTAAPASATDGRWISVAWQRQVAALLARVQWLIFSLHYNDVGPVPSPMKLTGILLISSGRALAAMAQTLTPLSDGGLPLLEGWLASSAPFSVRFSPIDRVTPTRIVPDHLFRS